MGGGGSSTVYKGKKILSVQNIGGTYKDTHVKVINEIKQLDVPITKLQQQLLKHKFPKEKLIQVQKLKFVAKGNLQKFLFFRDYFIKYRQHPEKIVIQILPQKHSKSPQFINYDNNRNEQGVWLRALTNVQQQNMIQKVKKVIIDMKNNKKKFYQGKLTLYDMVKNVGPLNIMWIVIKQGTHWLKCDDFFIEYLKKTDRLALAKAFQNHIGFKYTDQKQFLISFDNPLMNQCSKQLGEGILKALKNTSYYQKILIASKNKDHLWSLYHIIAKDQAAMSCFNQSQKYYFNNFSVSGYTPQEEQGILKNWKGYAPLNRSHFLFPRIYFIYDEYGKSLIKK